MGSTFGGIEIGKSGLQSQQRSMDVTAHNISNADNEEYSRQRAIKGAKNPHAAPSTSQAAGAGQIGTGVKVDRIERVRDDFIDQRIQKESHSEAEWSTKKEQLQEVEAIYNDLEDGGVVNSLDEFWDSYQELANEPESMAVRETVVQKGETLTNQFNHINNSLVEFREQLGSEVEGNISELNSNMERVASLNQQVLSIESDSSKSANDILDERDKLLEESAEIADISVNIDENNLANVSLDGSGLVSGTSQNDIEAELVGQHRESVDGADYNDVEEFEFSVNGNRIDINGGEVKGLTDVREDIQDNKMNKLDRMVREFKSSINQQHNDGYGLKYHEDQEDRSDGQGVDFFDFNFNDEEDNFQGFDIEVNEEVMDDPAYIAAADEFENDGNDRNALEGNGENALNIAKLRDETNEELDTSFNDFWQRQSSELGIQIDGARRMHNNQEDVIDNLKTKREEISGVSLDEEMADMVKFQHGYNASARVLSTMDEMLSTLVNQIMM